MVCDASWRVIRLVKYACNIGLDPLTGKGTLLLFLYALTLSLLMLRPLCSLPGLLQRDPLGETIIPHTHGSGIFGHRGALLRRDRFISYIIDRVLSLGSLLLIRHFYTVGNAT